MTHSFTRFVSTMLSLLVIAPLASTVFAAPGIVPGSGTLIDYVGDDFENPEWSFVENSPKSSREQDERVRSPTGYSTNRRWTEGPERGYPDFMKVIPTPPGGLAGSEYSLLLRTKDSGVPGRITNDVMQDDLIVDCIGRLGMTIPVSDMPNVVARVYLPPADEWEDRSGPQFGFRISTQTTTTESKQVGFFGASRSETEVEPYWPGIWIHFRSEGSRGAKEDSAFLTVRGDRLGRDIKMKDIPADQFGWWTLGISVTPDGMVHYYASPGVDDLTAADHLTSQFPYSFSAQRFRTFFFDVCNYDNGRTWSTPFVIDDPQLYVVRADRVVARVKQKVARAERIAAQREAQQKAREARAAQMKQRNEQAKSSGGNNQQASRRSSSNR